MHQFFIEEQQIHEKQIIITGADAHHMLHVLRLKPGEEVSVRVTEPVSERFREAELRCAFSGAFGDDAELELLFIKQDNVELPVKIRLYQGLPKADKMELIIQKAVELGASAVVPVMTKRCVSDWKGKAEKKRERLQLIAEAAAKQAHRGILPEVALPVSFGDALKEAAALGKVFVPYELAEGMDRTRELFTAIEPGDVISVFIGPEGGFTEEEVQTAKDAGAECITLGRRILRTETAGLYVLSVLGYLSES